MPAPQLRVFPQQANSESLSLTRGIRLQCGFGIITKIKRASDSFRVIGRPGSPPQNCSIRNVSPPLILVNGTSDLESPHQRAPCCVILHGGFECTPGFASYPRFWGTIACCGGLSCYAPYDWSCSLHRGTPARRFLTIRKSTLTSRGFNTATVLSRKFNLIKKEDMKSRGLASPGTCWR